MIGVSRSWLSSSRPIASAQAVDKLLFDEATGFVWLTVFDESLSKGLVSWTATGIGTLMLVADGAAGITAADWRPGIITGWNGDVFEAVRAGTRRFMVVGSGGTGGTAGFIGNGGAAGPS